ncbi:ATPase [Escherichia coli]|nr:ATPase [Escherichia coli]
MRCLLNLWRFIMMSLVSGEHNTPALSLQDESPGLVPAG